MHNTNNFNRPVSAGDRVLVRACGIAYVGGNIQKPCAYSLCGSQVMTLSEVMSLAGGIASNAATEIVVHNLMARKWWSRSI